MQIDNYGDRETFNINEENTEYLSGMVAGVALE